jgi:DNA polymerase III alpha subunit
MQWCTIDLHLHTRASSDFQQPEVTYIDLLHRAEARGMAMIAFTDHNTVAGYRGMQEEIHQLKLLEGLKRILPEEQARLNEYRRLLGKIMVFRSADLFTPMKYLSKSSRGATFIQVKSIPIKYLSFSTMMMTSLFSG